MDAGRLAGSQDRAHSTRPRTRNRTGQGHSLGVVAGVRSTYWLCPEKEIPLAHVAACRKSLSARRRTKVGLCDVSLRRGQNAPSQQTGVELLSRGATTGENTT